MNYLKYTNGVGHLIMSTIMILVGVALIFAPNSQAQGVGIGLVLTVQAAWFIPGSAKQVAYEVQKQVTKTTTAPLPTSPVTPGGESNGTH